MPAWLTPLLDWLAAHPALAGVVVLLIACAESLALVGLLLPGAALMWGIGALIGSGHLAFWPTFAWAVAGAVLGDGLSYLLGRHYRQQLAALWPLSRHPDMLLKAQNYFDRHGGKSIFFARFVGPLRPLLPAVAGMACMQPPRFLLINLLSALLWAPAYLLPGMLLALSVGVAGEVTGRLGLLLLVLLVGLGLLGWGVRLLFDLLQPHLYPWLSALLRWSRLHPRLGELPAALLDPHHREARGVTLLALLLLATLVGFAFLLGAEAGAEPRALGVDGFVAEQLTALRTPWADALLAPFHRLATPSLLALLYSVLLIWLAWQRRWSALWHAGALLAWGGLVWLLLEPLSAVVSGPLTLALLGYGFLAVVIARELPTGLRRPLYLLTALLLGAQLFARLYFGDERFGGALAGVAFGVAGAALFGIAYRRHPCEAVSPWPLLGLGIGVMVVGLLSASSVVHRTPLPVPSWQQLETRAWFDEGWRSLPMWRDDLSGAAAQPFNLHYAGRLEPLGVLLEQAGWQPVPASDGRRLLASLAPTAKPMQLALLPRLHRGEEEAARWWRPSGDGRGLWVVRLWPAYRHLLPEGAELWLGGVERVRVEARLPGLRLLRGDKGYAAALAVLRADLARPQAALRLRRQEVVEAGQVLLVCVCGGNGE